MNLSFHITPALLFIIAASASFTGEVISTTGRHISRHDHKVNCLSCFCGPDAAERARHECPHDRDLILCPPSIPVRICYRCSCFPRIPVSPSPLATLPGDRKGDDKKQDKNQKGGKDRKQDRHHEGEHDHEDEEDIPTPTPDDEAEIVDMGTPNPKFQVVIMSEPTASPSKKLKPSPLPIMPSRKPHPSDFKPKPSKKPKPSLKPTAVPSSTTCTTFSRGGGGRNTVFDVDLLQKYGAFNVTWIMDGVPDKLEIFYEGKKVFTTAVPVKGAGMAVVKYSGKSSVITVSVTSPKSATAWLVEFGCPTSD